MSAGPSRWWTIRAAAAVSSSSAPSLALRSASGPPAGRRRRRSSASRRWGRARAVADGQAGGAAGAGVGEAAGRVGGEAGRRRLRRRRSGRAGRARGRRRRRAGLPRGGAGAWRGPGFERVGSGVEDSVVGRGVPVTSARQVGGGVDGARVAGAGVASLVRRIALWWGPGWCIGRGSRGSRWCGVGRGSAVPGAGWSGWRRHGGDSRLRGGRCCA